MSLVIAETLEEALMAVATGARPVAGGTDLVVAARQSKHPLPPALVAIDRLAELSVMQRSDGDRYTIGSAVTHASLLSDETVLGDYTALADAAALIGSPSTRNVGTLGGNVMNASPAMDTGGPLVVLGATVQLASSSGSREVELPELWTAPGSTSAAPDELCVSIDLPARSPRSGSAYIRLEYRRAMEIAVVGASASLSLRDDGTVDHVRVALTAVAPTIVEVDGLDLAGESVESAAEAAAAAATAGARPLSDLRASEQY
ncbi:MAG: FAD binding domain-containing protein, partial [Acidimicrobiales bacterium]